MSEKSNGDQNNQIKKILYLDFLYPNGHVRQNETYINCLSQISDVYVISDKKRYKNLESKVTIIENSNLEVRKGRFISRIDILKNMIISAKISNKIKPDIIFISSFDTMMFFWGKYLFKNINKIFLLHHVNVDELKNILKKFVFKIYSYKVNHIVFEKYIKTYLNNIANLNTNQIYVLPHQTNMNSQNQTKIKYDCVGLSMSNDEAMISKIIELEKQFHYFKKGKRKVILKSKNSSYDNGFLKVINGYLNEDIYNDYISNCASVFMPFPITFKHRMSGTLVDALSNEKIVFSSDIPLAKYYKEKYPDIIVIIDNEDDFIYRILSMNKTTTYTQYKSFYKFKQDHSEESIIKAFKKNFKLDGENNIE